MKKLLATAAAIAVAMSSTVAHADDVAFQGQRPTTVLGFPTGGTTTYSTPLGYAVGAFGDNSVGYTQQGSNDGNTQAASPSVTNTWLIKGTVTPDCSYYGGSTTSHTLDFGQIGVHTEATTGVSTAFDMVSAATAEVNSTTAGCNTNNTVTITKNANGLVNAAAGIGYDNQQFQANIPYTATAEFTATSGTTVGAGTTKQVIATGASSGNNAFGAWRSAMKLSINAPAPNKALVAGDYSDTVKVVIAVL